MKIILVEKRTKRLQKIVTELGLSLCLLFPLIAQNQSENRNGVVFGTIMNVTIDSSTVTEQEVTLYQYVNEQEAQGFKMQTMSDKYGVFTFEELEISDSLAYYPTTLYKDVEYSGELVKPSTTNPRQQSDILIFEPTTSDSAISAVMHHLIIEPGVGALIVREILIFANRDNHTYVGNTPMASGKNIVLQLGTPIQATELQLSGDLMSCCTIINGNQVINTMEFKPGIKQVVLNYILPYKRREANVTKTIYYPTENFDIFLLELQLSKFEIKGDEKKSEIVSIDRLKEPEPFEIRGKKYDHYHVGSIERGNTFSLLISNLTVLSNDYRWLAPVILISIIIISYFGNRKWRLKNHSKESRDEL